MATLNKISLAGDLGSGKSTVSKILIDRLGATYYCTGAIVRSIADEMGMTVVELNKYMETHPEIDTRIDDGIRALSSDPRTLVIDSRMAWHFTEGTFKVYLSTDIETSALRIMSANRPGEHAASLEDTVRDTRARRASEQTRYSERYGVDIKDLTNYSLVVDTTYATPERIAEVILEGFALWQRDAAYTAAFISAERLKMPDDEADMARVAELSAVLDCGGEIPTPRVFETEGDFFVDSGAESVLAYSLSDYDFIPVKLCRGKADGRCFVETKNSL